MRLCCAALLALSMLLPAAAQAHPAAYIIDLIWEYSGGHDTYKKARYVEFTFNTQKKGEEPSSRKHKWDRFTGDYVLEFKDSKTGHDVTVYFNVDTKAGTVVRNGKVVEGDDATELLDRAYRIFINDTYWVLAPMKLRDYGSRAQFIGHEDVPHELEWHTWDKERRRAYARALKWGHTYDERVIAEQKELEKHQNAAMVMHVWFEGDIGLTPGDEYWYYVSHEGKILKWQYKLEGGSKNDWLWMQEQDCGMGLKLCTRRETLDGERAIFFPDLRFSETMDRAVFTYNK